MWSLVAFCSPPRELIGLFQYLTHCAIALVRSVENNFNDGNTINESFSSCFMPTSKLKKGDVFSIMKTRPCWGQVVNDFYVW